MRAGLEAIAPHLDALCELVVEFGRRYQRAKADLDALDFADLERGAYDLLTDAGDPAGLSVIARELHDRFAHVLVDEFQDINPLQAAILRLVSRETEGDRADNLFCVGDVKQSIYRFRLAEPELFQARIDQAEGAEAGGSVCVHLQENFRSTPQLIEGINLLFERLMTREMGGVDYDESVRLRPGNPTGWTDPPAPIELHLLERRMTVAGNGGEPPGEERLVDPTDPAGWEVIQREACLIGRRMLELRASGLTADGEPLQDVPCQQGDVLFALAQGGQVDAHHI